MASKVKLAAQRRSETGKGAARSLRRAGYVPAIVYGHGEETQACQLDWRELEKVLTSVHWENTVIDLKIDNGKTANVLIREVQLHPCRPEVLHVDFLAIHKDEKVKLDVPIEIIGVAPGVKEGGILEHHRMEVEIRCLPSNIPQALEIDVSGLGMGDVASVQDLVVPEGVEILSDLDGTVCSVVPPAVLKQEVEEAEAELEAAEEEAEPEVIGRGKPAEEEETEEG
ncbi:MAG: 50S ribosomal protein L25/general stress protein Ctc [Gemmatimonadales bacterium]|jgi:large subunit ribosomal protein L25